MAKKDPAKRVTDLSEKLVEEHRKQSKRGRSVGERGWTEEQKRASSHRLQAMSKQWNAFGELSDEMIDIVVRILKYPGLEQQVVEFLDVRFADIEEATKKAVQKKLKLG